MAVQLHDPRKADRVEAANFLGIDKVSTIRLEDLTEAEIRVYIIADNRPPKKWVRSHFAKRDIPCTRCDRRSPRLEALGSSRPRWAASRSRPRNSRSRTGPFQLPTAPVMVPMESGRAKNSSPDPYPLNEKHITPIPI